LPSMATPTANACWRSPRRSPCTTGAEALVSRCDSVVSTPGQYRAQRRLARGGVHPGQRVRFGTQRPQPLATVRRVRGPLRLRGHLVMPDARRRRDIASTNAARCGRRTWTSSSVSCGVSGSWPSPSCLIGGRVVSAFVITIRAVPERLHSRRVRAALVDSYALRRAPGRAGGRVGSVDY
jgi:hypothetical protein